MEEQEKTIEQIAAEKTEELRRAKLTPGQVAEEDKKLKESAETKELKDGEEKSEESSKESLQVKDEEKPKAEEKPKEEVKKPEAVTKREKEIQAEIDKLISAKKAIEHELGDFKGVLDTVQSLKTELANLKAEREIADKRTKEPTPHELAKEFVNKNAEKFVAEDRALPREDRREMAKEEFEEWITEDMTAALSWMNRRDYRREREKEQYLQQVNNTRSLDDLRRKQQPYLEDLLKEYPGLKIDGRMAALKEEGKSDEEIDEILTKENEQYKVMMDVIRSDRKKFLFTINSPALVLEEMKKRLSKDTKKADTGKNLTADDEERIRQEAAEAERQRQSQIDAGITSTTGNGKVKQVEENLSEFEKRVLRMAAKRGISADKYKEAVERRKRQGYDSDENLALHGVKR